MPVYCDMETDNGGWTVFQRRKDGSVDFNRGWSDYERGFGNLSGDYWLGLASVHQLLQENGANELRIEFEDYSGDSAHAKYNSFNVEDSTSQYRLRVSGYSGTAGDAIAASGFSHYNANGMKFSTRDRDHDSKKGVNCAAYNNAGWWFNACSYSFLNNGHRSNRGSLPRITWHTWKGSTPLSFSEMKFRRRT